MATPCAMCHYTIVRKSRKLLQGAPHLGDRTDPQEPNHVLLAPAHMPRPLGYPPAEDRHTVPLAVENERALELLPQKLQPLLVSRRRQEGKPPQLSPQIANQPRVTRSTPAHHDPRTPGLLE